MGLTKEEKKALKLAKKLEKAKAQADAKKSRKRDELDRELAAHEMQRVELDTRLHKMMVAAKEPVYKQAIEVMLHTFDRTIDKKNHLIDHFMHLRRIADDQHQRTISSFCVIVDGIMGTFLSDLEAMCKETDKTIEALLQQGVEETNYIKDYQKNAETHLNLLLFHSHELADALAWTIRGENFVKIDEVTTRYIEIRDDLRMFLEGLYSAMWEEFKGTLKSYIASTAANQKEVRILRKKESMMDDIIALQAKKIAACEGIIKRLRIELAAYESGTKQAVFRDRRERHKDACLRLKLCFMKGVNIDEKQLDRLVMMSNDSIKYLKTACNKSEKILRLAAQCRKYETHHEKVLPFGSTGPFEATQVEPKSNNKSRKKELEDSLVASAISSTCGLTRLWQRMSKVQLSKRALYREKMQLEEEYADMLRVIEMRGKGKLIAKAMACQCAAKTLIRSLDQPHAVDGSLEARKFSRYY